MPQRIMVHVMLCQCGPFILLGHMLEMLELIENSYKGNKKIGTKLEHVGRSGSTSWHC